jgi:hypothetical protein
MSFFIGFVQEESFVSEVEEASLCGAIMLGSTEERFSVPLCYWDAHDYEMHWNRALLRIVGAEEKSCLITAMYDPSIANFIVWWPLYRTGETIIVQNQILFLDRLTLPFDEDNPFRDIGDRRVKSTDGSPISEWAVELGEVQRFLEGKKKSAML